MPEAGQTEMGQNTVKGNHASEGQMKDWNVVLVFIIVLYSFEHKNKVSLDHPHNIELIFIFRVL